MLLKWKNFKEHALNSKGAFWTNIWDVVAGCVAGYGSKFCLTSVLCAKHLG